MVTQHYNPPTKSDDQFARPNTSSKSLSSNPPGHLFTDSDNKQNTTSGGLLQRTRQALKTRNEEIGQLYVKDLAQQRGAESSSDIAMARIMNTRSLQHPTEAYNDYIHHFPPYSNEEEKV